MDERDLIIKALEKSPYWSLLGFKVRRMEPNFAEIYLPVRKELGQIFNVLHGGATISLMDAAGAVSLFNGIDLENEAVTTVEMKINYLESVTLDEKEITARSKVVKKGKKISVCSVEIYNDAGKIIAVGIATYAIVKRLKK